MRVALSIIALLAACGNDSESMRTAPDAAVSPVFEIHVWLDWDVMYAPDVTSVIVDGYTIPSGTRYQLDEWYTSYATALIEFRPRAVSFTNALGATTESIDPLADCPLLFARGHGTGGQPVKQEIRYSIDTWSSSQPSQFAAYSESCTDITGENLIWEAR